MPDSIACVPIHPGEPRTRRRRPRPQRASV